MIKTRSKIAALIIGLALIAFGAALFSRAELGFDPFMVFDSGLSKALNISLGTAHISINIALLLIYLALGQKRYIHIGTVLAMTLTGPLIDVFFYLTGIILPGPMPIIWRMTCAGIACLIEGVGVYFYTGVRLGAGPNDLAALIISDKTKKPLGLIRILIDGVWLIAGMILGGLAGLGTVMALLIVGATVQVCVRLKLFSSVVTRE